MAKSIAYLLSLVECPAGRRLGAFQRPRCVIAVGRCCNVAAPRLGGICEDWGKEIANLPVATVAQGVSLAVSPTDHLITTTTTPVYAARPCSDWAIPLGQLAANGDIRV